MTNTIHLAAKDIKEGDSVKYNGTTWTVQKAEPIAFDRRITIVPHNFDELPILEQSIAPVLIYSHEDVPFLPMA